MKTRQQQQQQAKNMLLFAPIKRINKRSSSPSKDKPYSEYYFSLHQVKETMRELESFCESLYITLEQYPHILGECGTEGVSHNGIVSLLLELAYQHLDTTFNKITLLFKALMTGILQMESDEVNEKRINSFRQEVLTEWERANNIKEKLIFFTQRSAAKKAQDDILETTTTTTTTTTTVITTDTSVTTTTTTTTTVITHDYCPQQ